MPLSGAQVTRQWLYGGPGHNYGSFAGKVYIPPVVVPEAEEQPSGGFRWWLRYEQEMLRREDERRRLEESVDAEISALIRGEEAPQAEAAAKQYLDDLSDLIQQEQVRQTEFRQFIGRINLDRQQSELARLLAIDRAIRLHLRRMRDEEEFVQMLMMIS